MLTTLAWFIFALLSARNICVDQGKCLISDFNNKICSLNLRNFDNLNETNEIHLMGKVAIFNGELMAIAGSYTRAVEIMRNGQWENIKPIGNGKGKLDLFSTLSIPGNPSDALFVFGMRDSFWHAATDEVWQYDNQKWKKYHSLQTRKYSHHTTTIGDEIFNTGLGYSSDMQGFYFRFVEN